MPRRLLKPRTAPVCQSRYNSREFRIQPAPDPHPARRHITLAAFTPAAPQPHSRHHYDQPKTEISIDLAPTPPVRAWAVFVRLTASETFTKAVADALIRQSPKRIFIIVAIRRLSATSSR